MENKINVAELLKDCPKGMELDCTMFDDVKFSHIQNDEAYPIVVTILDTDKEVLTAYGTWNDKPNAKCVIFPKGKTNWEGFQRTYINGDIVCTKYGGIAILNNRIGVYSEGFYSYCGLFNYGFDVNIVVLPEHLATEEEKIKLFDSIKANGYKWNEETKTLEKLIEPKFKVGDRITNGKTSITISHIDNEYYCEIGRDFATKLPIKNQDEWDLISEKFPNKFDINSLVPFESRVLVRHNRDNKWCGSFFSHIDEDFHSHCYKFVTTSGKSYPMCIPYEGNEHLLGTTDDCDEFYKTWK